MYKGEKHIAISFLLVFLLPILYQPVHILEHHSQRSDCCLGNGYEDGVAVQKDNHCYICEYEFTVTNLPVEFDIPFIEAFVRELIPAKIKDIFSFELILHTSPRAPPFRA